MLTGNSIGIDYHSKIIQVSVLDSLGNKLGNRKCGNDVGEVIRYAEKLGPVRGGAIEVSCGAAAFADEIRQKAGWDLRLCHPGFVNRMKNNPDKTDASDGLLLADLHRVGYLPEVWLAPLYLRDLKQIIRLRCQEVDHQRKLKQRIRSVFRHFRVQCPEKFNLRNKCSKVWVRSQVQQLPPNSQWVVMQQLNKLEQTESDIKELEKKLTALAKNDNYITWLITKRGIGLVTAVLFRSEIGTITRFRRSKQFARFCGLTPCNHSSGDRVADSGLIRAGCPELKRAILQVAHILRRRDPRWALFAKRLEASGKSYCVVVAAIGNRWLRQLYHEMRNFELEHAIIS